MRRERPRELHAPPGGGRLRSCERRRRLPIHAERVDVHARREIVATRATGAWRTGLVYVEEQLDHQARQRVRTVVEIRYLLGSADRSIGRKCCDSNRVAPAILPIRRTGAPIV